MEYKITNEEEEEYALKDLKTLCWWLWEKVEPTDSYKMYFIPMQSHDKTYAYRAFKRDNAIYTVRKFEGLNYSFFMLLDNNRILKCSISTTHPPTNKRLYNFNYLVFEIYDNADKFVITKTIDESANRFIDRFKELIEIKDDTGRVITKENEYYNRFNSKNLDNILEVPVGDTKLVDLLKPVSLDDIYKTFEETIEYSKWLLKRQGEFKTAFWGMVRKK